MDVEPAGVLFLGQVGTHPPVGVDGENGLNPGRKARIPPGQLPPHGDIGVAGKHGRSVRGQVTPPGQIGAVDSRRRQAQQDIRRRARVAS
jgi:hypothetical protein